MTCWNFNSAPNHYNTYLQAKNAVAISCQITEGIASATWQQTSDVFDSKE